MREKNNESGKRRWKIPLIVTFVLGLIAAWLGFGKSGLVYLYQTEMERQSYVERIRELTKENKSLMDEIERLRTDMAYVESVVRKDFNMVKSNEIIYRFADKEQSTTEPKGAPKQDPATK